MEIEFDCVGVGPKTWSPAEADLERWILAFPGIKVENELRQMQAWILAHPSRRKTHSGMNRFVVGWLSRSQNAATRNLSLGRRSYDPPPDYSASIKSAVNQRSLSPTAVLRLAIERQVRAEHPEWGWNEVRVECAKRFNEQMAGSQEAP